MGGNFCRQELILLSVQPHLSFICSVIIVVKCYTREFGITSRRGKTPFSRSWLRELGGIPSGSEKPIYIYHGLSCFLDPLIEQKQERSTISSFRPRGPKSNQWKRLSTVLETPPDYGTPTRIKPRSPKNGTYHLL